MDEKFQNIRLAKVTSPLPERTIYSFFSGLFWAAMTYFFLYQAFQISLETALIASSSVGLVIMVFNKGTPGNETVNFESDRFRINYVGMEALWIEYKDVLEIRSPAIGSKHTAMLVVDSSKYPVFQVPLYNLEDNMHEELLHYLMNKGVPRI